MALDDLQLVLRPLVDKREQRIVTPHAKLAVVRSQAVTELHWLFPLDLFGLLCERQPCRVAFPHLGLQSDV